jgi:hypothetical protein
VSTLLAAGCVKKKLGNPPVSIEAGKPSGIMAIHILRRGVSASPQKEGNHVYAAASSRAHECGSTAIIARVNFSATPQKLFHIDEFAVACRSHQRGSIMIRRIGDCLRLFFRIFNTLGERPFACRLPSGDATWL